MAPEKQEGQNPKRLSIEISEKYGKINTGYCISAYPNSEQIYDELKNQKNPRSIVKGIFLYTDEDVEMVNYIEKNFQSLDKLSGDWSEIYLLKQKTKEDIGISRWLSNITLGSTSKPFNRNESYDIARKFNVPFDAFPCLIFLLCDETLFSHKKLIIPIKEVSAIYFRKLFTVLEEIVNNSQTFNKYEELENNFDSILSYLNGKSSKISSQTTTEYQVHGQTILFIDKLRSIDMSENNQANISESNMASVFGPGQINTAIVNKYPPEQRQTLSEAAVEIKNLLDELSVTYAPPNPTNNLKVATETVEAIESNPALKTKIINALKVGGTEAFKELINHPALNIFMALIEGWSSAE